MSRRRRDAGPPAAAGAWREEAAPGDWREEVAAALGVGISAEESVGGGDIAEACRLTLADGERVFLKRYPARDPEPDAAETGAPTLAQTEARGLAWLAEARALRVAAVAAVGTQWLALEWIESAAPGPDFDRVLGEGLAALHAHGADTFGLDHDNFIGRLPQRNRPAPDWATFYARERLAPLRARARRAGQLPIELDRRLERLIERLPERVGPQEPPARLHGDLWQGNVLSDPTGAPCLIDPAAYAGHREMDLAMMRLFGGFAEAVFEAYARVCPLAEGAHERVALYQIHPLLVHVCLFGRSYLARLASCIDAALTATPEAGAR